MSLHCESWARLRIYSVGGRTRCFSLLSLSFFLYTFSSIWHIRMQCVCVHRAVCRIAVSINANCLTLARISILRCAPCYKFDLNSSTSTTSISINQHEKSQTRIFNFVYCEIEKMGWIVCENCKNQARSHERVNECDLRKPNWMCDIMFKQWLSLCFMIVPSFISHILHTRTHEHTHTHLALAQHTWQVFRLNTVRVFQMSYKCVYVCSIWKTVQFTSSLSFSPSLLVSLSFYRSSFFFLPLSFSRSRTFAIHFEYDLEMQCLMQMYLINYL